ncbi:hypothetical protein, partial [Nitratireductor sp. CH_MIT9313-5]|uniref:hypothetical protein n=1 Tax=Nitratireductor sp. CH_MIT9313-5 TaxID=3107764 RepID=UPI003008FC1D
MRDTRARNKSRRKAYKQGNAARTAVVAMAFCQRTSFAGVTLSTLAESTSQKAESLIRDSESEDLNLFQSEMPCLHVEMHSSAGGIAFSLSGIAGPHSRIGFHRSGIQTSQIFSRCRHCIVGWLHLITHHRALPHLLEHPGKRLAFECSVLNKCPRNERDPA